MHPLLQSAASSPAIAKCVESLTELKDARPIDQVYLKSYKTFFDVEPLDQSMGEVIDLALKIPRMDAAKAQAHDGPNRFERSLNPSRNDSVHTARHIGRSDKREELMHQIGDCRPHFSCPRSSRHVNEGR